MNNLDIVNHNDDQYYVIQDPPTGFTYAVKVLNSGMIGWCCTSLTPHLETVKNTGRRVSYLKDEYMYSYIYDMIEKELGL